MRIHLAKLGAIIALPLLVGCQQSAVDATSDAELSVTATFYPLAEFGDRVLGRAGVQTIVPNGTEPHEYEPTPQDIVRIQASDIFLLNGGGVDAWAEAADARQARRVLMEDLVPFMEAAEPETDEHGEDDEEHGHDSLDPHVWLDPMRAKAMVAGIAEAFAEADPANGESYRNNAVAYGDELEQLHAEYAQGLANCTHREIIVSHDAFGYLAKRYGFTIVPIAGLSPDAEPSAQQLAHIADLAREHGAGYIFTEPLTSPKLAETIAQEVGVKTLTLNPLEGLTPDEQATGRNVLSVMRQNLQNLRTAMRCQ